MPGQRVTMMLSQQSVIRQQQPFARDPVRSDFPDHQLLPRHAAQSAAEVLGSVCLEGLQDGDTLLALAHQEYKAGNYKQALKHCNVVHERSSKRTDVLLLLGAIYYQLHDFDMCIAKNEEALRIDPQFAECYGNMANAFKEKGNVDLAIQYYLVAIELRPGFCDAWSNLASAYMRKGRLQEAAACCRHALTLNPRLVDAHSNLGNLLKAQGLAPHAYYCYAEAIRIQPTFAIAWSNLAGLLMEAGDYERALAYYQEAIRLKPNFADAHLNLGNALKNLGKAQESIVCYLRAIQLRPDYAIAYDARAGGHPGSIQRASLKTLCRKSGVSCEVKLLVRDQLVCEPLLPVAIVCLLPGCVFLQAVQEGNLASVYYEQGQLDQAILHYHKAIMLDSSFIEAYNNLGNALKDAGRVDEAIACYQHCLTLQANHPQALTNLGNIYMEWNMISMAANFYKATLNVTTGLSAPYSNLATIYKQQGHYAEAIACYNEVLRIDPTAADGLVNRGNTLKEAGRVTEAIQDYLRAVAIRPNMAEGHANLASAYKDSGHVESAIKSYKQALQLRIDFPEATCNLLHTLQCVCDWDGRDKKFEEVQEIIKKQIKMEVLPSVQPFHAIAYPLDPLLALEISRKYAEHCSLVASRFSLQPFVHPPAVRVKDEGGSGRLRLGYVSSDFGNHPLSHLMGSVFKMHNRKNVEVFCYALSQSDGSEWRQRIMNEAEHFKDMSAMSSDIIARTIADDQIQVLVNLNGYTKGAKNEIFALKPAPIQVSYMGFPGTTGAQYIDYLVVDELVCPNEFAHIYSEKLVHLPHCYFVNDYKQKNRDVLDSTNLPKRSDYGLPEDKFIFACFNQLYKMDPEIFTTWCNILKRVPNSALWLLRFPAAGEDRLKAFAVAQGVGPGQIIFTDVAAKNEHIRRSALADLFLDTPLCNAHTTGTDVLWAGLPMITLPLEKMATRVAMSLCYAAGFGDEMVVKNMQEYEDRAVMLAENPKALESLTSRLRSVRLTCPLFDTERWVVNAERCYFKMWNLYCDGKQPQAFKVAESEDFPSNR